MLLADDHVLFVESLKTVLTTRAGDMTVAGVAYDGEAALAMVAAERPDIVLMDVRMPVMDGVESTRLIKERYPQTKVLMLTTFDDDEYVIEALRLGAVGYILKDVPPEELISAIRAVCEGGVLIAPKVAARIVARLTGPQRGEPGQAAEGAIPSWLRELSPREKKVLQLLAEGYDNKEIADRLFLAEQTIKNHVSAIYAKMGVKDRVHAMRKAKETDLR